MSINVGDVVIEKSDPDESKWTVCAIYDDPQNLSKIAVIQQFNLDADDKWSLTTQKININELKKVGT